MNLKVEVLAAWDTIQKQHGYTHEVVNTNMSILIRFRKT